MDETGMGIKNHNRRRHGCQGLLRLLQQQPESNIRTVRTWL